MTYTYSGNPASSIRDAIRFYCQDINISDPFLTDEEIEYIATAWASTSDHPLFLSSVACEIISARFAREITYSADGVSVGASELQDKYKRLALSLRDQFKSTQIGAGPDISGIMIGEILDSNIKALSFSKGMHDNIEAGQQDFGGVEPLHYDYPEKDGSY